MRRHESAARRVRDETERERACEEPHEGVYKVSHLKVRLSRVPVVNRRSRRRNRRYTAACLCKQAAADTSSSHTRLTSHTRLPYSVQGSLGHMIYGLEHDGGRGAGHAQRRVKAHREAAKVSEYSG